MGKEIHQQSIGMLVYDAGFGLCLGCMLGVLNPLNWVNGIMCRSTDEVKHDD